MTTLKTKPSTPRLSEAARHVVIPKGIVTTAWPRIVAQCADMGVGFDPWQHGIGSVALGKRKDGKYAATVGGVVLSIPRQVGKTFLVGMIVIALCVIFPKITVIWTAHRTRTATKTFQTLQAMVKRKKVWPHVAAIRIANGEQEIRFRNGSVIMFGAREQGFGRGFDEVDVEVFDEAQILSEKALEDIIPAANQSRQESGALLFFMGTPPRPTDTGDEFTNRRTKALSGKSDNMVYVEFSADSTADSNDRAQWAKANPSFPRRTPIESMERMRENLTDDDSFRREGLGIWDDRSSHGVISPDVWASCLDTKSKVTSTPIFALDVAPSRNWSAIGVAGMRADGLPHIEITSSKGVVDHRLGTDWVVPRMVVLAGRWPGMKVAIASGSAAESLVPALQSAGIELVFIKRNDVAAACGLIYDLVTTTALRHLGQPELTSALATARKAVEDGEGAWRWGRKRSSADITPLYAATLALWVVIQSPSYDPLDSIF